MSKMLVATKKETYWGLMSEKICYLPQYDNFMGIGGIGGPLEMLLGGKDLVWFLRYIKLHINIVILFGVPY